MAAGIRRDRDVGPDRDAPLPELLNTREVADYVRLKERKIYDLVSRGEIPCTRVSGKWLFPRRQIDAWLAGASTVPGTSMPGRGMSGRGEKARSDPAALPVTAPPVIAGSHDPFLEWCAGESGCGLAMLGGGSLDGLERLAKGEAVAAGLHVLDPATGEYNLAAIQGRLRGLDVVAIEWAVREQGLVLAPGNPLGIAGLPDLAGRRLALRQPGSGSHILLRHLMKSHGLPTTQTEDPDRPLRTEMEIGYAVLEGEADAGLAIRAVAHRLRLDFLPLHRERFDLVMRRRDYFEPAMQALLGFVRTAGAGRRAETDGYDIRETGRVRYNAPN